MIRNYLKVGWRNFLKNKVFSFINVFGLTVGLTCCMLITLYLLHETSYDSYQKNIKRLYQIGTTFILQGHEDRYSTDPAGLADVLKYVFPQIEATARIRPLTEDKTLIQYHIPQGQDRSFYEEKGILADSGFFKLFTYDFIEGNSATAMNDPYSIVLSEEIAEKLFGHQSALGKTLHISSGDNGDHDYTVSGVFRPSPIPSHIEGRFFMSMYGGNLGNFLRTTTNLANNNQFYTYLLLKPGADPQQLEKQFPAFVDKYEGKDLKQAGFYKKQFLLPVRDIHLKGGTENGEPSPGGSTTYLYVLGSIALFTLLIACINFMNLATARSTKRSAEVGVRKALGAKRFSLVIQFLEEALLMALIAYLLALCFTALLLPGFEHLSGKEFSLSSHQLEELLAGFFLLAVITGLIAGSYPAFYLSSFRPVRILKGKLTNSLAVASMRKGLVVFQFVISVILIVASVVIGRQMNYLRNADLGFIKDQQLVLPLRSIVSKKLFTALKNKLQKDSRVISVGGSSSYPGITTMSDQLLYAQGKTISDGHDTKLNYVDFDYLKTLSMKPVAGRLFSNQFPADSVDGIVLNEKAISLLGYTPAGSIGKKVYNVYQGVSSSLTIVGVVKDFHFEDLHVPISPFGFEVNSSFDYFDYMMVHVRTEDMSDLVSTIEKDWHQLVPDEPFDYNFLDEQFQRNYDADNRLSAIVSYFTIIAICICCLGLFGLAAFSAEQRTREIGIRKTLGASNVNIVGLLTGDFVSLVGVAIIVASPVAWWIMQKWLRDFAYRTSISWTVFAYTAALALLIALATISSQAIRAATSNPVKSLRSE